MYYCVCSLRIIFMFSLETASSYPIFFAMGAVSGALYFQLGMEARAISNHVEFFV